MSMYKRYEGSFVSRTGHVWKCRIFQENPTAYTVADLDFPADSPLVIEWYATAKSDVICGSTATLTLDSPGDRTYLDLYTIRPGNIRLDVLRDDVLYWSGCLDPEHSEEPYSSARHYDVTLTFSDFGIMHRLKYNMTGMQTMQAVLTDALSRAKVNYGSLSQSYISTLKGGAAATLASFAVRSDNFYDEEGEPMTLYDVVEGMLRPLGLRIVQKGGVIHVYDLNGIEAGASTRQIRWESDDQTLGMDRVYNNVRVAFSPYADTAVLPEFEYTGEHSKSLINLTTSAPSGNVEYYTFYPNYGGNWDATHLSFTVFVSDTAKGIAQKNASAKYYHIEPLVDGSEHEGLAVWFYVGHASLASGNAVRKGALNPTGALMVSKRFWLPKLSSSDASAWRIRLTQEMLVDCRYNPFFNGDDNESGNQTALAGNTLALSIPVKVQIYGSNGNVLCHYQNKTVRQGSANPWTIYNSIGTWESGAAADDDCVLYFYNIEDGEIREVIGDWVENRQAVALGYNISSSLSSMGEGQFMPYPTSAGELEVIVLAGAKVHRLTPLGFVEDSVGGVNARWFMLGAPQVELVKANAVNEEPGTDDIEYSGEVNPDAEEGLELSTVVGTMETPLPTAKGLLFDGSTYEVLRSLTRAGRNDCPEQLLIGTLFSQHADRVDVLSGTCAMGDGTLKLLTDANLTGKKLLPMGEMEDAIADECQVTAIELIEDEYVSQ